MMRKPYGKVYVLQEFQYGKDVFQATTILGKQFAENRQLILKSLV